MARVELLAQRVELAEQSLGQDNRRIRRARLGGGAEQRDIALGAIEPGAAVGLVAGER